MLKRSWWLSTYIQIWYLNKRDLTSAGLWPIIIDDSIVSMQQVWTSKGVNERYILVCSSHKSITWLQKTWVIKKIALWYLDGGLDWILIHFHYMEKSSEYMIQHSSFYVPQKKKIMQFWNDIRLIKWWQNYHFNEGHATVSPQTP